MLEPQVEKRISHYESVGSPCLFRGAFAMGIQVTYLDTRATLGCMLELAETRMGVTGSHGIHTHPANNNYKVLYNGAKWSTLYSEIPKAEKTGKLDLRTQCMPRKLISMACQFR